MSQQYQNRQQRRAAERTAKKQSNNLKTDLLPPLREQNNVKLDLPSASDASLNLSPAGPFLNPITQQIQDTPWIPPAIPDSQIPPQGPLTSGSVNGGNELPVGLQPLKPKEQKLADDLSGLYYLLGTGVGFASQFGGKAIILQAPLLSESHVRMARHIPKYYQFLENLVQYNDFVPIFATHLAVVAAIMTYHDMVPEAAKAHFTMLGLEITQKVELLEAMERASQNNGTTSTQNTPYAVS